jgi:hypothetical protein
MRKMIPIEVFRKMPEAERKDVQGILKGFALTNAKAVDEAARTIDFTISLGTIDRQSDTVNQDGWELDHYLNNPVVLFAHDNWNPPVAQALNVWKDAGNLMSRSQFTPRDMYPFGFMIFQMYLQGYMRAVSVGFAPKDYKFVSGDERPFGIDFLKQELLEYSCVPVPAHPDALIAARSAGIDTLPMKSWAERALDACQRADGASTPEREGLERLRKASDPAGKPLFLVLQELRVPKSDDAKADPPEPKAEDTPEPPATGNPGDETVDPVKALTAVKVALVDSIKAGRTLSKKNEDKLRSASDSIGEVLAQLEDVDPPAADPAAADPATTETPKADDPPVAKEHDPEDIMTLDDSELPVAKNDPVDDDVHVLSLDEEEVLTLDDEPAKANTPATAGSGTEAEVVRQTVGDVILAAVQDAIREATGAVR